MSDTLTFPNGVEVSHDANVSGTLRQLFAPSMFRNANQYKINTWEELGIQLTPVGENKLIIDKGTSVTEGEIVLSSNTGGNRTIVEDGDGGSEREKVEFTWAIGKTTEGYNDGQNDEENAVYVEGCVQRVFAGAKRLTTSEGVKLLDALATTEMGASKSKTTTALAGRISPKAGLNTKADGSLIDASVDTKASGQALNIAQIRAARKKLTDQLAESVASPFQILVADEVSIQGLGDTQFFQDKDYADPMFANMSPIDRFTTRNQTGFVRKYGELIMGGIPTTSGRTWSKSHTVDGVANCSVAWLFCDGALRRIQNASKPAMMVQHKPKAGTTWRMLVHAFSNDTLNLERPEDMVGIGYIKSDTAGEIA